MDLPTLINKRKYIRGEVTRIHGKVQSEEPSLTREEKIRFHARIKKVQAELEIVNDKIFNLFTQTDAEADAIHAEYDRCNTCGV